MNSDINPEYARELIARIRRVVEVIESKPHIDPREISIAVRLLNGIEEDLDYQILRAITNDKGHIPR